MRCQSFDGVQTMPILTSEIKIFKTTNGLGGAITATESLHATPGNLIDTFTGAETAAGGVFYVCEYIKNTHVTLTAQSVVAKIASETAHPGINVSMALGSSVVNGVEPTIADENTAPAGVTFADTDTTTTGEATEDDSLAIGDIPAGQHQAVWFRITIDASTAAKTGYQVNINIDFDTAE